MLPHGYDSFNLLVIFTAWKAVMDATYENLTAFVRKHGSVTILDTQGRARKLPSGEPDVLDVIDRADRYVFVGKWYSRNEFEALMDQV